MACFLIIRRRCFGQECSGRGHVCQAPLFSTGELGFELHLACLLCLLGAMHGVCYGDVMVLASRLSRSLASRWVRAVARVLLVCAREAAAVPRFKN